MVKMRAFFLRFVLSIIVVANGAFFVRAEAVTFRSALVWRPDGRGDYSLPALKPDSIYTCEPVTTDGLIESISVSWQAQGEVKMEVSADNGLNYVRAVNGVPAESGFVQGTGLRWRAALGKDAKLSEVRMGYSDASGVVCGFGQPVLSGFKYRKKIHITGSKSGDLYGYQVRIIAGESEAAPGCHLHFSRHARPDFGDVHFALPDSETLLPYYLEKISGEPGLHKAEFFVRVRQIPPEGIDLYVYYANPFAKSPSDPQATFDLYDDFKDNELDARKWDIRLEPGGSYALTKEGLLLDAAGIMSKIFEFKDGIIEYSATAETGYETRLIIRDADPDSQSDAVQVAYASGFRGAEHCIAVGNTVKANVASRIAAITRYDYRVIARGADIIFERYSPGSEQRQAIATYRDPEGPRRGHIGLKTSGAGRGRSRTRFHWVRVRKYADMEPRAVESQEAGEELAPMALFENIALDHNGDLIPAAGYNKGVYAVQGVRAPYAARVISPTWEGGGISVDVSADGGRVFKRNCSDGAYYYTARGDFKKGEDLGFVVRLGPGASRLKAFSMRYAPGNITVLSPNGDETWLQGSTQEITWTAMDYEASYPVRLEYSTDGAKTFKRIAEATENDGEYQWKVPSDIAQGSVRAVVKVSDANDSSVNDLSDQTFIISSK